ncbi:hypothetical protein L596_012476 [Steinernema carpocapsae]|uniref:Uncharacterized protein n=1 Tax=Steinernema carpocapsae TaxID=34508 RepID=A0A4U5NY22_STECR|nr:hypothetical protein L596_012476 [Steinernema carpocapsae]
MQFVPIATDDRRLLATGDVETWRRNCCDIGASEVVAVEERLHLILDGKLNEIEDRRPVRSQTTAFPDGFRDEEELVLTRIQSGFGTHFLVTAEGVLLAKGATSSGQCGVVQAEYVKEWRRVDLVNPQTPCKHGTRPSATNKITVSDVVCSQKQVCVLDSSSRIWTYGNGNLHKDKNGAIICKLLNLMPNRRVIQFAAGRGHFLALVEHSPPSTIVELPEGEENVFDGRMLKSCADCLEDERMRLSNLMIEADKAAETSKIHLIPVSASTPIAPKKSASSSSILLSNVVQGSADSWSLPGLRKGRRSRESCGDIEMTTISHEFRLGRVFVHGIQEFDSGYPGSGQNERGDERRSAADRNLELGSERMWTVGPWRLHCEARTVSGEQADRGAGSESRRGRGTLGGVDRNWRSLRLGSNCRGQLKQTEQTHVAQPFLFKVGSQSSVLDVAAGGQSTAVIVSGIDSTPVVYYCGSHSKQMPDGDYQVPLTLRIAVFEKIGWPLAVSLLDGGRQLFLGFHPRNVDDETDVSMVFNTVFGDLKFARMIVQLTKVAQQLHERSQHYQKSEDACKLLNDLTVSLSVFSASVARIANSSLYHLSRCGDVNLRNLLGARENDDFYSSIQKLHKAYVGCIAYGCFADIRIEWVNEELLDSIEDAFCCVVEDRPELEAAVERLCLEYEAESAKQHRRLGKLFQMAFMCVSQIKQMREQLAVGDAVKECNGRSDM